MRTPSPGLTTAVWIALVLITLLSWWLAPGHSAAPPTASTAATLAVVALAALKGRLIIRHFMEVASAPKWLRYGTDGWLLALWGAVLALYLI